MDPTSKEASRIGKLSLEEQEVALGIAMQCEGCKRPASTKITMYAPKDEFIKRWPELAGVLMARSDDGTLPVMNTPRGPMVPFSCVGACSLCKKELLIAAARAPSWCYAQIDETHPQNPMVSVTEKIE